METTKRKRKPWQRAFYKFIPLLLILGASTDKSPWVQVIYPLLAYCYLWLFEDEAVSLP